MLYLADNGIMADGTDLSEAMCRGCSEKAKSKGYNLNIFPANMTEFNSDRKYSCAIIARSGFMHLIIPYSTISSSLRAGILMSWS